jgi:hypothetical protein
MKGSKIGHILTIKTSHDLWVLWLQEPRPNAEYLYTILKFMQIEP